MPDKPDFVFVQHVARYIGDILKEERKLSAKTNEDDSKLRIKIKTEFIIGVSWTLTLRYYSFVEIKFTHLVP